MKSKFSVITAIFDVVHGCEVYCKYINFHGIQYLCFLHNDEIMLKLVLNNNQSIKTIIIKYHFWTENKSNIFHLKGSPHHTFFFCKWHIHTFIHYQPVNKVINSRQQIMDLGWKMRPVSDKILKEDIKAKIYQILHWISWVVS